MRLPLHRRSCIIPCTQYAPREIRRGSAEGTDMNLRTLLLASSVLTISGHALSATAQPSASAEGSVDEVVVTGSRIQSTGYERPTPVTVVTAEALKTAQPASIAAGLQE